MNTFSYIRLVGLAAGISCAGLVSCSNTLSPQKAAKQVEVQPATVYSHNDQVSNNNRRCVSMGALPIRARRALTEWMHHSEIKTYSYVYPQYYISMPTVNPERSSIWAICTDAKGKMVGVLVPRTKVPAWELPNQGDYDVYVCTERMRDDLGRAILESLADADMDSVRIDTRRSLGLREASLISAPAPLAVTPTTPKATSTPKAATSTMPTEPIPAAEEESDDEATPASDDSSTSDDSSASDDASSSDDSFSSDDNSDGF